MHERISGSLYGLLVGDALGCPVEGVPPSKIAAVHGRLTEMVEPTERWRPCGLHSDDGQQAMALCDAILLDPAAPERGFAVTIVEMYDRGGKSRARFGEHRGTGKNFRQTVLALAGGASPADSGQPSSGNGVAMMIAPAAWYWRKEPARLAEMVLRIGRVKQRDVRGIASAAAIAWLVARALVSDSLSGLNPIEWLEFVRDVERRALSFCADAHQTDFSDALAAMIDQRTEQRDVVLNSIVATANRTSNRQVYAGSGYALASVVTSAYISLTATSYEQAILDVVHLGGDTDTTAAMVGAVCGALFGYAAIPVRWLDKLVARGAFEDRLDPLVERKSGWTPKRPLVDIEAEWNRKLFRRDR